VEAQDMEIVLKGFEDWAIDTAHNDRGKRWVDIYKKRPVSSSKAGLDLVEWDRFGSFDDLNDALDCLIDEGLCMTEDQVCEAQESCS